MAAGFELPGVIELEDDTGSDIHDFPGTTLRDPRNRQIQGRSDEDLHELRTTLLGKTGVSDGDLSRVGAEIHHAVTGSGDLSGAGNSHDQAQVEIGGLGRQGAPGRGQYHRARTPGSRRRRVSGRPHQSDHKGDDGGKRDAGADQYTPPPGSPCLPPSSDREDGVPLQRPFTGRHRLGRRRGPQHGPLIGGLIGDLIGSWV